MFRLIGVVLVVALALHQATAAIDVSKQKNVPLEFSNSDVVPKNRLKSEFPEERGAGFIGDLTVGQRYADEVVFRRTIEYNNPTQIVQSSVLNLSIMNGAISYISARNAPGSYAVVCDDPSSLGSSRGAIKIRVPPNSKSSLTLIIASQNARIL
ncbi:uncharacterized protein LOC143182431 [Calliopsis andreniformis]|uniref:uncharacterized protein LOC143182431 n=1 Tax=Calliopsis andreniformis TaxID=337506 RepID=UPI003FCEA4BF